MKLLAYKDANLLFDLLKIFSICIIGGLEGKQHTSFFGRFTQQNHFRFFSLLLKPITRTFQISQHQDLHASNIGLFLQQIPELKKVIYKKLFRKKEECFLKQLEFIFVFQVLSNVLANILIHVNMILLMVRNKGTSKIWSGWLD